MTEKRFYLMNVEDPLHEYGRWCKPVLEDGETGKQYESALEVMDLLNEQHELILQGFEEIAKANDEKFDYKMKVKEILQKHYDILFKKYAQGKSVTREKSWIKLELLELLADELGVDLE